MSHTTRPQQRPVNKGLLLALFPDASWHHLKFHKYGHKYHFKIVNFIILTWYAQFKSKRCSFNDLIIIYEQLNKNRSCYTVHAGYAYLWLLPPFRKSNEYVLTKWNCTERLGHFCQNMTVVIANEIKTILKLGKCIIISNKVHKMCIIVIFYTYFKLMIKWVFLPKQYNGSGNFKLKNDLQSRFFSQSQIQQKRFHIVCFIVLHIL